MAAEALYDEALALAERDRAKLARLLLESLESEADDDSTAAWNETISRRARELAEGRVEPIAWDDARAEILRELERRRANRSAP